MGLFETDPHDPTARRHAVEIVGKRLHCSHCGGTEFWEKDIQITTTTMNAFGLDEWGERTTGFACATCGHIEHFCNYKDFVRIWPDQQPTDKDDSEV